MKKFDWDSAKQTIINILESSLSHEEKREKVEAYVHTLPFDKHMNEFIISYNSCCGYPWWVTHKKYKEDNWKLRELLDSELNSENDIEYICPVCFRRKQNKFYDAHIIQTKNIIEVVSQSENNSIPQSKKPMIDIKIEGPGDSPIKISNKPIIEIKKNEESKKKFNPIIVLATIVCLFILPNIWLIDKTTRVGPSAIIIQIKRAFSGKICTAFTCHENATHIIPYHGKKWGFPTGYCDNHYKAQDNFEHKALGLLTVSIRLASPIFMCVFMCLIFVPFYEKKFGFVNIKELLWAIALFMGFSALGAI